MACSVLIVGHGTLPKDMMTAAEMIYGAEEGADYICLPANQDLAAYKQEITDRVLAARDSGGLLVLADFKGGTPFLTVSRIMKDFWDDEIELVTGLNLPMLTEVLSNLGQKSAIELAEIAVSAGGGAITNFREALAARNTGGKK